MKLKEEKEDDKELQEQRPESPKLQELEDPEFIEDYPYFYIDKPVILNALNSQLLNTYPFLLEEK